MAEMYSTVDLLANDLTLYTSLQGITMQLLIIRLIRLLSAQQRLSILTSTAIKVAYASLIKLRSSAPTTLLLLCRYNMRMHSPSAAWSRLLLAQHSLIAHTDLK